MNLDSFFGSLKDTSSQKKQRVSLEDTDLYKVGMFKKIICNMDVYKSRMISFLKNLGMEDESRDFDKSGEHLCYVRAYSYIKTVTLQSPLDTSLESLYDENLIQALSKCTLYYEKLEEYEKCALLKKVLDYFEK